MGAGQLGELDQEIITAQQAGINSDHLKATLAEFDSLWDVLIPHERGQLIHSLVERVVCKPEGEVKVVFRASP